MYSQEVYLLYGIKTLNMFALWSKWRSSKKYFCQIHIDAFWPSKGNYIILSNKLKWPIICDLSDSWSVLRCTFLCRVYLQRDKIVYEGLSNIGSYERKRGGNSRGSNVKKWMNTKWLGERGGLVIEPPTPRSGVQYLPPPCSWARHIYLLKAQEAVAPFKNDWKLLTGTLSTNTNQTKKKLLEKFPRFFLNL